MTRAHVALAGTFGYELDITKISEEERAMIPEQVSMYHKYNDLVREGDYYRVASYRENGLYDCWMVVAKDKSEALVTYVQVLGRPNMHSRKIKLLGLYAAADYRLDGTDEVYGGDLLMNAGKGLAVKLHDEINGIAALALAVAKPLVSPDGQAVMFFPTVFPSAFDKCLSLCAEKIFQTDGVRPVNLCLGVIHRDSSSFFCRVWGRFWSFCSSVRSLNRAAVSTHDLTFQRRCKSSLTVLNSP